MATSDEGYRRALRAARKAASAEPVVNAAAMAALRELSADASAAFWKSRAGEPLSESAKATRSGYAVFCDQLGDLIARFTVRELGGEVRDD